MKILVTGSAGHLGEALMRTLPGAGHDAIGIDILASPYTTFAGSIVDRDFVRKCMRGVDAVLHAATLHKPHVATHPRQAFIDTNVTGTLNLLEEATAAGVGTFVFTSTTSTFGHALHPAEGDPAAWVTEDVQPIPKNIYGVTKVAAENLCELFHRSHGMHCIVLRTSRFFPEEDDLKSLADSYDMDNIKANEYLYRRVEIADAVDAHLRALERAAVIGFGRYIISATTPFQRADVQELTRNAPQVVANYAPAFRSAYQQRQWRMFPSIDRVYVNERARTELGWRPRVDFHFVVDRLSSSQDFRSDLSKSVGSKGYHRGKAASPREG